jgi:uncharacterized protein YndB with AHSA1/START domain
MVGGLGPICPQKPCFFDFTQVSGLEPGDGVATRRPRTIAHRMRAITVSRTVDAPRERVFRYLSDIANHAEFSDHYLHDFRLERLDSSGMGASASYRLDFPLGRQWGDAAITDLEAPHRVVLEGRTGRIGRIRTRAEYTLTSADHDMTRVEYRFETQPGTSLDRLKEALGLRGWLQRAARRALGRLAHVLEEGEPSARAVRPAAG